MKELSLWNIQDQYPASTLQAIKEKENTMSTPENSENKQAHRKMQTLSLAI